MLSTLISVEKSKIKRLWWSRWTMAKKWGGLEEWNVKHLKKDKDFSMSKHSNKVTPTEQVNLSEMTQTLHLWLSNYFLFKFVLHTYFLFFSVFFSIFLVLTFSLFPVLFFISYISSFATQLRVHTSVRKWSMFWTIELNLVTSNYTF